MTWDYWNHLLCFNLWSIRKNLNYNISIVPKTRKCFFAFGNYYKFLTSFCPETRRKKILFSSFVSSRRWTQHKFWETKIPKLVYNRTYKEWPDDFIFQIDFILDENHVYRIFLGTSSPLAMSSVPHATTIRHLQCHLFHMLPLLRYPYLATPTLNWYWSCLHNMVYNVGQVVSECGLSVVIGIERQGYEQREVKCHVGWEQGEFFFDCHGLIWTWFEGWAIFIDYAI